MAAIRIAIVGVGKIVRDQHAPVIASSPDLELVATASPHSTLDGIPAFATLDDLLARGPTVDAVAVTSVAEVRFEIARQALLAGKAVLLEKPPCTTVSALDALSAIARAKNATLFASWHSRFASQVEAARSWFAAKPPSTIEIEWREDVRRWHPNQEWVWAPGGLGVFDPGINALAILTHVAPSPVFLSEAELFVPSNRQTPIAASLTLSDDANTKIKAHFDWRETGAQAWEIRARAGSESLRLFDGGAQLEVNGEAQPAPDSGSNHTEYQGVYRRFVELVRNSSSEVDDRPLKLAADAALVGRRAPVDPFES